MERATAPIHQMMAKMQAALAPLAKNMAQRSNVLELVRKIRELMPTFLGTMVVRTVLSLWHLRPWTLVPHYLHRFHFLIAEQTLYTVVGGSNVMAGQLDRVLTLMSLSRVHLGVIPSRHRYTVPTSQFCMLDDRVVLVETISAELTVTQPREIALYSRAFDGLTKLAKYGKSAKDLIHTALETYR